MKRRSNLCCNLAVIALSSGALVVDGSFKSVRAGPARLGVVMLGREVYAELIPTAQQNLLSAGHCRAEDDIGNYRAESQSEEAITI